MDIISSYSTVRKPSPNRLLRSLRAEEADNQHRCNGNRANGHKDGRNTKRGEHPTHHHRHQHIEQLGHSVREADAAEADFVSNSSGAYTATKEAISTHAHHEQEANDNCAHGRGLEPKK